METVEIKIYSFDELNEKTKEKVVEKNRDINVYDQWYDGVYDDAVNIGEILGIENMKIYFNGFWSQGDGACFIGDLSYNKGMVENIKSYAPNDHILHSIAERIARAQKENIYQILGSVKHTGYYYHYNSISFDLERNDYKAIFDESYFVDAYRDFCKWIYSALESEYYFLVSDEMIIESIKARDYKFTEEGEVWN